MKRCLAVVAMFAAFAAAQPASARERGPVCREPSVVDEMARQIRLNNYYSFVNPRSCHGTSDRDGQRGALPGLRPVGAL